jgi:D-beta-D-heptose 7-phosphate kinase/D-beta-D-heptose 1-phosphate adenosyltransferase
MNIWVNGCFDILHVGHLNLLQAAKKYKNKKNILYVGIDSDKRVKELKGNDRPINNENDRKRLLESLKMVDKVVIYDTQEEMCNYIKSFNIDYMMIGDEYKDKNIFCREFSKNDVVFFPKDNRSSSKIIEKIKKS